MIDLFQSTAECLALTSPAEKCKAVSALALAVEAGQFEFDPHTPVIPIGDAGRPAPAGAISTVSNGAIITEPCN